MKQHPSGIFIGKRYKLDKNPFKEWGTTHRRIQEEITLQEIREELNKEVSIV